MSKRKTGEAHSHMWLVGMLGLISGLVLMIYVPSLKRVSEVMFLFTGFHLVGAAVALSSIYMMSGAKPFRRLSRWAQAPDAQALLDFGWAPSWAMGPLVASVVCLSAAVAIQVAAPQLWPLALLGALLAASFFAGHLFVAWVPGWHMFAIASLLSFFLTSESGWRKMAAGAGFEVQEEGTFNGVWYLLLRSPAARPAPQ